MELIPVLKQWETMLLFDIRLNLRII